MRDLATSGLFTDDIDRLFLQLDKPYRYSPTATAYSFKYGWVRLPPQPDPDDIDEFMQEHLEKWLRDQAFKDNAEEALNDVTVMLAKARAWLKDLRRGDKTLAEDKSDEA